MYRCVCAFLWNATLTRFGQSETVRYKGFCFGPQTTKQLIPLYPFWFDLLVTTRLLTSADPYHYIEPFDKDAFFLQSLSTVLCLPLPRPGCLKHRCGFIWKRRGSRNAFLFLHSLRHVPALLKGGEGDSGSWKLQFHLNTCFSRDLYAYPHYMYVETMNVCQFSCLISLLADVALLGGVLWEEFGAVAGLPVLRPPATFI